MEFIKFIFSGPFVFIGFAILFSASINVTFRCWNRYLRSRNIAKHGWPPKHVDADGDSVTTNNPEPPFEPGQKVTCVRQSIERCFTGARNDNCRCSEGNEYTIDGCVWSYSFGWLVSISGELHDAKDFEEA